MLYQRQKVLLSLLEALGGDVSALDFQKLLFLYVQEMERDTGPSYEFVPYQYGGFSFTSYADKRKLQELGILQPGDRFRLAPDWKSRIPPRTTVERFPLVASFVQKYGHLRGDALVALAYRRYPRWAARSRMAERVLAGDAQALSAIAQFRPRSGPAGLCSIGYEGRSLENYLNTLLDAGVTLLCDVRRNPISRKYGFSRSTLAYACEQLGIAYQHLPELGIDSAERQDLRDLSDYEALFARYRETTLAQAADALRRIASWVRAGHRVALTCYERDPRFCHRTQVARAVLGHLPEMPLCDLP